MYRDLLELKRQIEQRIDKQRAPYVAIAAGTVYLIGFNTVLATVNVWYFGFVLLVAVLSMPFLFTAPASPSTTFLALARGFLTRNPRAARLLFFAAYPLSAWAMRISRVLSETRSSAFVLKGIAAPKTIAGKARKAVED